MGYLVLLAFQSGWNLFCLLLWTKHKEGEFFRCIPHIRLSILFTDQWISVIVCIGDRKHSNTKDSSPGCFSACLEVLTLTYYWLINWSIDRLVGWLVGWLVDWLTDWLIDWLSSHERTQVSNEDFLTLSFVSCLLSADLPSQPRQKHSCFTSCHTSNPGSFCAISHPVVVQTYIHASGDLRLCNR